VTNIFGGWEAIIRTENRDSVIEDRFYVCTFLVGTSYRGCRRCRHITDIEQSNELSDDATLYGHSSSPMTSGELCDDNEPAAVQADCPI